MKRSTPDASTAAPPSEETAALALREAGVLLAPMIVLAAYALWLRIGQYGLTPDRVVAVACVVAGLVYASAAARRPPTRR